MRNQHRREFILNEGSLPDGGNKKRKRSAVNLSEKMIVEKFTEIAFSEDARDSDRLRALDWLSCYFRRTRDKEETLEKLDKILSGIKNSF